MQNDALNKKIRYDRCEKSEPHPIDLINYLKKSKYRKAPASQKDRSSTASMTPMVLLLV